MKALKFLLITACLSGIVYLNVWQRVQILRLGYEIAGQEARKEHLLKERRLLRLEHSRASAFDGLSGSVPDEFSDSVFESMNIVDIVIPRDFSGGESGPGGQVP